MTLSAAVSGDITDKELKVINYLFTTLPVFENSNNDHLSKKIIESMEVIKSEPNVENIVDLIGDSLEENSNLKKTRTWIQARYYFKPAIKNAVFPNLT